LAQPGHLYSVSRVKRAVPLILLLAALCACGNDSADDPPVTTTIATRTSSTSTTETSSTTWTLFTTTSYTTTTTTLLDCTVSMEVVFSVTNTETLGALQYETTYPRPGSFLGEGRSVFCTKLAADFVSFNEIDRDGRLISAFVSLGGFTGPLDIATCEYCTVGVPPEPGDFAITIVDQARPDFSPANATVAVTQVNVIPGPSTTTTTLILP
jgi:hypothetical protein